MKAFGKLWRGVISTALALKATGCTVSPTSTELMPTPSPTPTSEPTPPPVPDLHFCSDGPGCENLVKGADLSDTGEISIEVTDPSVGPEEDRHVLQFHTDLGSPEESDELALTVIKTGLNIISFQFDKDNWEDVLGLDLKDVFSSAFDFGSDVLAQIARDAGVKRKYVFNLKQELRRHSE